MAEPERGWGKLRRPAVPLEGAAATGSPDVKSAPVPVPSGALRSLRRAALALATALCVTVVTAVPAAAATVERGDRECDAECCHDSAPESCGGEALQPSYEPRPPEPPEVYTTDYFFATTRAVAGSTIVPAGRVPLFFLTIPIDIALLPIAAIAGFFPGD